MYATVLSANDGLELDQVYVPVVENFKDEEAYFNAELV